MPGVRAVITAADLDAAGISNMPAAAGKHRDGSPTPRPPQRPLATDRVRYVGEPIAMVVAETAKQAKDAAEAVFVDIDPLPAVTTASAAAAPGCAAAARRSAGQCLPGFSLRRQREGRGRVRRRPRMSRRLSIRNNRIVVCPMEPRSAIGEYDAESDRLILRLGCQGVFGQRNLLSGILGVPVEKLRVLTGNVGGSFGMKASAYPEYICLLHAARTLGRPVKWTDERSESFMSDSHGRDHEMTAELALDADGKFLALRVTGYGNLGAWLSNATTIPPTMNTVKNIIGVYATPLIEVSTKCMFTNTTPVGAYRGAGRPEGNYYMERLVETAAREMGIDRVELRRRNHIQPEQMPYRAPSGMLYDSGEFPTVMDKALRRRRLGRLRRAPGREPRARQGARPRHRPLPGSDRRRRQRDGRHPLRGPTAPSRSSPARWITARATPRPSPRCCPHRLGIPFERIKLLQGDSDELLAGGGTGGSRSMMQSGGAIVEASDIVIERGKQARRAFPGSRRSPTSNSSAGASPSPAPTAASASWNWRRGCGSAGDLPDDVPRTLDVSHIFKGVPSAFPNGCHIAEVELDPETGVVEVVSYATVNDFGVLVNPMLVAGQAHGGIAQGIGQALMESVVYDEDGQLLTGSYMDYALPRASDLPGLGFESHPVPARTNPLGAKGCGEAGCAGSLPAVMNALVDALSEFGITHIDMPATPQRIWQAIQAARGPPTAGTLGCRQPRPALYPVGNCVAHQEEADECHAASCSGA